MEYTILTSKIESKFNKIQLENELYNEFIYYNEDIRKLAYIICRIIPYKYCYRIIAKLHRIRINDKNL